MENFADLYADTLRFTADKTRGGAYNLHAWFSPETAYLPIVCRTLKILNDTVRAIQDAAIRAGNSKPKMVKVEAEA